MLDLGDNPNLTTLDGLNPPSDLSIALSNDPALVDLSALGPVQSMPNGFSISQCNALTNLHGLEGLVAVQTVYITFNDALTSLHALGSIGSVGDAFIVGSNESLPTCEVNWLLANIGTSHIGGTIDTRNNDDTGTCSP